MLNEKRLNENGLFLIDAKTHQVFAKEHPKYQKKTSKTPDKYPNTHKHSNTLNTSNAH